MKLEHFLTPYTKWIKDLNVRPESIKLLEENIGRILSVINHSKILYDPPPWVMEIKTEINLIKLKSFFTMKETIRKVKRKPLEWEKTRASKTTDKELISRIHKQLMQLNISKMNNPVKKWAEKKKKWAENIAILLADPLCPISFSLSS